MAKEPSNGEEGDSLCLFHGYLQCFVPSMTPHLQGILQYCNLSFVLKVWRQLALGPLLCSMRERNCRKAEISNLLLNAF
jgi:hypothetical protein